MTDKQILLIEDNADDRDLTIRALKKSNVPNSVAVAGDGAEALTMLLGDGHDDQDLPALILLDLNMPKVDGFEVLRRIRADRWTRVVPVVILTSSIAEDDVRSAYDLGANGYVRKPIDYRKFTETINAVGLFWLLLNQSPPEPQPLAATSETDGTRNPRQALIAGQPATDEPRPGNKIADRPGHSGRPGRRQPGTGGNRSTAARTAALDPVRLTSAMQ